MSFDFATYKRLDPLHILINLTHSTDSIRVTKSIYPIHCIYPIGLKKYRHLNQSFT